MRFQKDANDDVDRPIVALGNRFPPHVELAAHRHRRNQFLYASSGVMAVSTPHGTWVAPPQRAVWIPAGIPHAVRMIDAVQTRSVLIESDARTDRGKTCQVVSVSPLLRQLLVTAADLPPEYDLAGRDNQVMSLLLTEINRAPVIPLAVPFPADKRLAKRCQHYLSHPNAMTTIDEWADALAMNRRTFTRFFRRETGMSFSEWRQQACVSIALTKLAAGEPVTAVALDLGYEGSGNFSTMFKRVLGVTPSQYEPN
jgi:AraC-like DNA-binding protein/mannose-6-phosphate isomerase-like protein (cupin superfamily)